MTDPFAKYGQQPETDEDYLLRVGKLRKDKKTQQITKPNSIPDAETKKLPPISRRDALLGIFAFSAVAIASKLMSDDKVAPQEEIKETVTKEKNHKQKKVNADTSQKGKIAKIDTNDAKKHLDILKEHNPNAYKRIMKNKNKPMVERILVSSALYNSNFTRFNVNELSAFDKLLEKLDSMQDQNSLNFECIRFFEGERLETYPDTEKLPTTGYGFLLPKEPEPWRLAAVNRIVGKNMYHKLRQIGHRITKKQAKEFTDVFVYGQDISQHPHGKPIDYPKNSLEYKFRKTIKNAIGGEETPALKTANIPRIYSALLRAMLYQCPDTFTGSNKDGSFKDITYPLLKTLASANSTYKERKAAIKNIGIHYLKVKLIKDINLKDVFDQDRNRYTSKYDAISVICHGDIDAPLPIEAIALKAFTIARDQQKETKNPPIIVHMGKKPAGKEIVDILRHPNAKAEKWENGTEFILPLQKTTFRKDKNGFQKITWYKDEHGFHEKAVAGGAGRIDFNNNPNLFEEFKDNLFGNIFSKGPKPTHA